MTIAERRPLLTRLARVPAAVALDTRVAWIACQLQGPGEAFWAWPLCEVGVAPTGLRVVLGGFLFGLHVAAVATVRAAPRGRAGCCVCS